MGDAVDDTNNGYIVGAQWLHCHQHRDQVSRLTWRHSTPTCCLLHRAHEERGWTNSLRSSPADTASTLQNRASMLHTHCQYGYIRLSEQDGPEMLDTETTPYYYINTPAIFICRGGIKACHVIIFMLSTTPEEYDIVKHCKCDPQHHVINSLWIMHQSLINTMT